MRRVKKRHRSISCSDREWERIGILAARSGRKISGYAIDSALAAAPEDFRAGPPRLVLDEAAQLRILDLLEDIARRLAGDAANDPAALGSMLAGIRQGLWFLADATMTDMIVAGRGAELHMAMANLLGEEDAAAIMEHFTHGLARRRARPEDLASESRAPGSRDTLPL